MLEEGCSKPVRQRSVVAAGLEDFGHQIGPPPFLRLGELLSAQRGKGQLRRLAKEASKDAIDRLGGDLQPKVLGDGGVALPDGLAQANQGAHRIQQQAAGPGHNHFASQPPATFSCWGRPGIRAR